MCCLYVCFCLLCFTNLTLIRYNKMATTNGFSVDEVMQIVTRVVQETYDNRSSAATATPTLTPVKAGTRLGMTSIDPLEESEWDDVVDKYLDLSAGVGVDQQTLRQALTTFGTTRFRERIKDISVESTFEEWRHEVARRLFPSGTFGIE
eukprot:GHVO01018054.1.p2 GENE.GHVO01018054.1~~GHVO01018054.1.p2  ORF type:complete len:149 (-),score=10.22 GHVO01018054.1:321-767(-)